MRFMSFTRREILELGLKGTAAMALSLKAAQLPAADFNFNFSRYRDKGAVNQYVVTICAAKFF